MSKPNCKVWYVKWKVFALAKKLSTQIFDFWHFITSLSPLKLEVSSPRQSRFLFNLRFLALWQIFCQFFFTYSESPLNFLVDKGLKWKNYSMAIEVMAVWKKLLANARIRSARVWHHQYDIHSNPTIILYKISTELKVFGLNKLVSRRYFYEGPQLKKNNSFKG